MQVLRKVGIAFGALLTLALIAAVSAPRAAHAVANIFVQVVNTASNPVMTNNVATLPSREVTLELVQTDPPTWSRILPDGSAAAGLFTVPAGQAFVLTDYSWVINSAAPNTTYTIALVNQNNFGVDMQGGVADASGLAFGSTHLNPGIAFTEAGDEHFVEVGLGSQNPPLVLHDMVLHGYLTPNQ
jgi:hypothetical protein